MACRHRFEIADMAVAGNQRPVGGDDALVRVDDDLSGGVFDFQGFGFFVQGRSGQGRLPCQPDHKFHRLDMAGAVVADAIFVEGRAKSLGRLLAIHEGQMRIVIAGGGDFGIGPIILLHAALVRDRHVPLHIFDIDAMRRGKVEQVLLGVFRQVEQRLRTLVAKRRLEFLGPPALTGAKLSAIAPRCAIAEATGLDQRDAHAVAGKVIGSLQPGEAAADNGDIGLYRT